MKGVQMTKNKLGLLAGSVLMVMLGLSQPANAATDQAVTQVQHIGWNKSGNAFQPVNASQLPANEANLIFIRPLDNDGLQTSANIAIDGRFQVSLQPGHYSQITYCSGQHNITVVPTGAKTNNLSTANSHLVDFAPQQDHYIFVDIDDATGQPNLSKLEEADAQKLLSTQKQQTHQISRVVRDCPAVQVQPEPEVKVELDKPINLKVLFEFDKAVVQPVFNQKIEAVAGFMKKYPETTTVIEGHTDSKGPDSYNMKLSQQRAEAVKQQLVTLYGIDAQRLDTVGYGETRPVDTNATDEGRYNNRRVVATVSAKQ
ncbi:Outer membrane porin F precursor [Psychrobacter pasteurii]|uniref:Outer membrane porin F n=2 Tax=Psychrobacter pasteurii TaxID=1945520 RepID=A0A1R4EC38_9GAMM|nr:Outer membrane porin F precursor [Psychrobacter pasteurii]